MNRTPNWTSVLPALIIPTCLGMSMYLGLSAAIEREMIVDEWLLRYLTGHPISKVTTFLFFVGVSSLLGIAWNVFRQFGAIETTAGVFLQSESASTGETDVNSSGVGRSVAGHARSRNSNTGDGGGSVGASEKSASDLDSEVAAGDDAEQKLKQLDSLPASWQEHYLPSRLRELLNFANRNPSAESFEDEFKYQSDIDLERKSNRYALARILIWATPMLGFLGTVLGISQALGGIDVGADNDFGKMMAGLQSSLYIAFDTTALALTLSMVLMFQQFLVDKFETELLRSVDYRVRHLLPPPPESIHQLSRTDLQQVILESNQQLVEKQAELWRGTIKDAEQAWISTVSDANEQIQNGLSEAIDDSVSDLANCLGQAIHRADMSMDQRWQQWQVTLSENARQLADYQVELHHQSEGLLRTVYSQEWDKTKLAEDSGDSTNVKAAAEERSRDLTTDGASEVATRHTVTLRLDATSAESETISTKQMTPELWSKFAQKVHTKKLEDEQPNIIPFPSKENAEANSREAAVERKAKIDVDSDQEDTIKFRQRDRSISDHRPASSATRKAA